MRKIIRLMMLVLAICILWGAAHQPAQAAKKAKVKVTLKKGVLTISGKGAMPANLKVKNIKKVKKVVIKKGITSIADDAFLEYENLKKVQLPTTLKKIGCYSFCRTALESVTVPRSVKTIGQCAFNKNEKMKKLTLPGDFTFKSRKGDAAVYQIAEEVETVEYNTPLKLNTTTLVYADNLIAYKGDPRYKSIGGVIYSKDGKSIVRVPFGRKELVIEDGCEEFCLQSILYCGIASEGEPEYDCFLKKIVIPASVKKVEAEKYPSQHTDPIYYDIKLDIRTKQVTDDSLILLVNELYMTIEEIMRQFPDSVDCVEDMYITRDGALLAYTGNATEVTIPAHVKKIANYAFSKHNTLKKVVLPEGLTEIGKRAFSLVDVEDKFVSLEVNFPSTLLKIGDSAFEDRHMKKLVLPVSVKSYGKSCFADNDFETVTLPDGIKVIPEEMFTCCENLKQIVIPDSVKTISEKAFYSCKKLQRIELGKGIRTVDEYAFRDIELGPKRVIVHGSSKGISNWAVDFDNAKINYTKGIKEMKAPFYIDTITWQKKKKKKVTMKWIGVVGADGYQLVIAKDKKMKKGKKTMDIKKGKTSHTVMVPIEGKAIEPIYGKIRPYKIKKGKKVYGRWTKHYEDGE